MNDVSASTSDTTESDLEDYSLRARNWLIENLQPRAKTIDSHLQRTSAAYYTPEIMASNRALQRTIFEAGYAGITWPKEYGGQGLSKLHEEVFIRDSSDFVTPDFGVLGNTTFQICVPTMLAHSTPAFLSYFIPKVLAGEALVCQFFSEPLAGSDLAGVRTRATRDGDQWTLSGQKTWSTFAHLADWGMCLTRTDWDVPKHRGLTWFAVPCNSSGLTIRRINQISDEADFCEAFFDDVVVPFENRIGEINDGWTVTQTMLVFERGAGRATDGEALTNPGLLAPDLVSLAQKAASLGDPVVRQKLARAHTIDFVGKSLALRIEQRGRLGGFNPGMAAYGKLFRGTYNPIRARIAVEIGGSAAMTWETSDANGAETSLAYLNGRKSAIAGGTNEIQRNGISERDLGLPREPSFDTGRPFSEVIRDANNWTS
jgi:alkylation response protein AidB-like acyl-CoA dehydrogenase